jgi:hypothetical protein
MPGMSTKKPTSKGKRPSRKKEPKVQATQERKAASTPFRPEDPRLLDALDAYAKRIRRSRNMAINLLLEAAMENEGLWPPAEGRKAKD